MPTKTATKKPTVTTVARHHTPARLSDEQMGAMIAKRLRAHPEAAPAMAAAAIREFAKGVDGARVRERLEDLTKKPAAKIATKK